MALGACVDERNRIQWWHRKYKGEHTMALTAEQLTHLRGLLEEQRGKLQDVLASLTAGNPASTTTRTTDNADVGTEATESTELVEYETLQRETTILLDRVTAALARLDAGTYGVTDTGEDIPYERLLVDPTVTTTVR